MARLKKYLSGYRRPGLSSKGDPYFTDAFNAQRACAYQMWLLGREAPYAGASCNIKFWKEWIADNMTPEAQARLDRLRAINEENQRRAHHACMLAGELLAWRGFGAYMEHSSAYGRHTSSGEWEWSNEPIPYLRRREGYYTDGARFIFIGTQRARGWFAQRTKPIQLIIENGRDPDVLEIERMLDDLLEVDEPELELAA